MKACFIGHRKIEDTKMLSSSLKTTIISIIERGVTVFLFGNRSDFDVLSRETVTALKKEYPFIKRIYVRANYPHINQLYEEYLLTLYDETYFPLQLANAGKASYIQRNFEMIDKSAYCIFYYNENYASSLKSNSGTKVAYKYALKRNKNIINLYKEKD